MWDVMEGQMAGHFTDRLRSLGGRAVASVPASMEVQLTDDIRWLHSRGLAPDFPTAGEVIKPEARDPKPQGPTV
jgi:hypothetical protein